jgi:hypothetical protein
MIALADVISSVGTDWPLFTMPKLEAIAHDIVAFGSMIESIMVANKVEKSNVTQWIDYASEFYQQNVQEGHAVAYGNLDRLQDTGYKAFLSRKVDGYFEPETDTKRATAFPGTIQLLENLKKNGSKKLPAHSCSVLLHLYGSLESIPSSE